MTKSRDAVYAKPQAVHRGKLDPDGDDALHVILAGMIDGNAALPHAG